MKRELVDKRGEKLLKNPMGTAGSKKRKKERARLGATSDGITRLK
jgi:hypothetical protein